MIWYKEPVKNDVAVTLLNKVITVSVLWLETKRTKEVTYISKD